MADEASLYKRCAEDIAFLELLGKVPVPPQHNPYVRPGPDLIGYALPLRAERHLTSTLAFLSSIEDDSTKITACCVRENIAGLEVLLAVNATSSHNSAYLELVKTGFERIFYLLKKAATSESPLLIEEKKKRF